MKDVELYGEVMQKVSQLKEEDKIELVLDVIAELQGLEHKRAFDEYSKHKNEYSLELNKAQDNYYEYERAYNILCHNLY